MKSNDDKFIKLAIFQVLVLSILIFLFALIDNTRIIKQNILHFKNIGLNIYQFNILLLLISIIYVCIVSYFVKTINKIINSFGTKQLDSLDLWFHSSNIVLILVSGYHFIINVWQLSKWYLFSSIILSLYIFNKFIINSTMSLKTKILGNLVFILLFEVGIIMYIVFF